MLSKCAISTLLAAGALIAVGPVCRQAEAQASNIKLPIPVHKPTTPVPVSLPHLYWHFLMYQQHLDEKATLLASQGKNTDTMRNFLQHKLGFTDREFAPLRSSGVRLATRVKGLEAQAALIRARGPSAAAPGQLQSLTLQRESYINAEVTNIRQALPPAKITALESAMTQMFSPANASTPPPGLIHSPAQQAVQP